MQKVLFALIGIIMSRSKHIHAPTLPLVAKLPTTSRHASAWNALMKKSTNILDILAMESQWATFTHSVVII